MMRRAKSLLLCSLILLSVLTLTNTIQPVRGSGTIYIRADGSIDPVTANITTIDNVTYLFTGNVYDSIVVERNNIVLHGVGYVIEGTGISSSIGVNVTGRMNVTISNLRIERFGTGIGLFSSSNNTVTGNTVTDNGEFGVTLVDSSNNTLTENNIESNEYEGINLDSSSNNTLSGNILVNNGLSTSESHGNLIVNNLVNGRPLVYLEKVTNCTVQDAGQVILINCSDILVMNTNLSGIKIGLFLSETQNTRIVKNNITGNDEAGIKLFASVNNTITGNNMTDNEDAVYLESSDNNAIYDNNMQNNKNKGLQLCSSSHNSISRNTITGSWSIELEDNEEASYVYGVYLDRNSENNTISENNITANYYGVYLDKDSKYRSVYGNNITDNFYGILLDSNSKYNSIHENNITGNLNGIWLNISEENDIYENNITDNEQGVRLDSNSEYNSIRRNNITGNTMGIQLYTSQGNEIYENDLTGNEEGVWLDSNSKYNSIHENNITNSNYGTGISLYSSEENEIYRNNITDDSIGIFLSMSEGNDIYENNITRNVYGVWLYSDSKYNSVHGNDLAYNFYGISVSMSERNDIYENNVTGNPYLLGYGGGIDIGGEYNSVHGNNITNSNYGITLGGGKGNEIYGNILTGNERGIWLTLSDYNKVYRNNITETHYSSINLDTSERNQIYENNIIGNPYFGVSFGDSHHNDFYWNNIINSGCGVYFHGSRSNRIYENNITDNGDMGIYLDSSCEGNIIFLNNITDNGDGVELYESSNSTFYHNNFVNNTRQVFDISWLNMYPDSTLASNNTWDDGYPSGGNYWSNYAGNDSFSGINQNVTGSDGIGDTPQIIDSNNRDRYPSMSLFDITVPVPTRDYESPIANAGPDQTVNEDTLVTLDGSASSDNIAVTTYTWTFTDIDAKTLVGPKPTYTFNTPHVYTITLNVTDAAGNWDTDQVVIKVLDVTAPIADAGPDQTVNEDTVFTFDGSNSTDNIAVTSYKWTFTDTASIILTGVKPSYTFRTPGTFTVTLNVTDAAGNFDVDTVTITVKDVTPPVANAGPDQTSRVNSQVTFSAGGSSDNIGIVSYQWNFGDGTTGTGATATHVYTKSGVYTVTLNVTDAAGNYGTDTSSVTVQEEKREEPFPWIMTVTAVATIAAVVATVAIILMKRKSQKKDT